MIKKLLFLLFFTLILTACGEEEFKADFSNEVHDFTATNQDGESFSKEQLDGEIWVANMFFTNCNTICPTLTANMGRLQRALDEEELDAQLVSFSVDPENDTPEIIKEYIENHNAKFDNWNALTGYSFEEIQEINEKSFQAFLEMPADSDQVAHVNRFFLVNADGVMVKRYDGTQADKMEEIVEDIKLMQ